MAPVTATHAQADRRLYRRRDGRLVAGVAAGLAEHLGVDVLLVRVVFVVLLVAGGLGAVLYAAFWAIVPQRDGSAGAQGGPTAGGGRARAPGAAQLLTLGALVVAALLVAQLLGIGAGLLWPATAASVGAAILWRQADDAQRDRWRAATNRLPEFTRVISGGLVARSIVGLVLVAGGLVGFLAAHGALSQTRRALVPLLVIIGGLVVITGPWMVQTVRQLTEERRARIREQERAEFAARVHDSVLQTLTLIQRNATDPAEVLRLARGSERELRGWLYAPRDRRPATLSAALAKAAADVEDEHGVTVDLVTVGDTATSERVDAVVQAAREAMVNAAKSSGASMVSVFAEVVDDRAQVFVRDRGRGFDLDTVPADRYGVRESIVARMARNGGRAQIRTAPGSGTEVALDLPLTPVRS
jgi:signal transduction histidine kinase/phage shock protein PspC (stress-responsive transcriptional regulator)